MSSVKNNFIYSSILTTINYIIPIIVFPYISRVLGVEKIGVCGFVDSVIQYFTLFSTMGITTLGIREIAKAGENKQQRSQIFSSLIILNAICTLVFAVVLLISIYTVEKFSDYKELLFIGLIKLCFNLFLVEWLYKGLEDFKYITIRTVSIRVLYVISVFIFVRSESDYIVYYFLTSMVFVINAIINIIHARKKVRFVLRGINLCQQMSPFFILGIYQIVTSLYTTFNVAYLGFISNEAEVGYYSTAHKFFSIIIALFTAFTGVMLPRMSSLLSKGDMKLFKTYINKSLYILIELSIPLIIFVTVYAPDLILLMSGNGYEGAILPMQIAMPLVLVIGYEQILIIQILMPLNKDKYVFINSCIGALVGLILNVILVPKLYAVGATLSWFGAEIAVLISAQIRVKQIINQCLSYRYLIKNLIMYIPLLFILLLLLNYNVTNIITRISVPLLVVVGYFVIVNFYILKNSISGAFIRNTINSIIHRF